MKALPGLKGPPALKTPVLKPRPLFMKLHRTSHRHFLSFPLSCLWREIRFRQHRDGEPHISRFGQVSRGIALSRSKLLASVGALASLEQGLYHRRVIDQLRLFHFETIARAGILGIALKSGARLRRSVVQHNWFHHAAISRV
jgi:hypothetical protein